MKKSKITLIAAIATVATVTAASFSTVLASADDTPRKVTFDGSDVFYAEDGATVTAKYEGENCYTYFEIGEEQQVTFRKNLAYSWYKGAGQRETFSLSVGFDNTGFESYTLTLQSQQYNKTEKNITENFLTFFPAEDGKLKVALSQKDDAEAEDASVTVDASRVDISFKIPADGYRGAYSLFIGDEEIGQVENVFESCAKYVSSGTSAAIPMIFSAKFAEDSAEDAHAGMFVYQLNGQSFEVFEAEKDAEGKYESGGYLYDDRAPVLCLNQNVNYLTHGGNIDIDYTVIDVIARSPRATVNYYVLSTKDYLADDVDYDSVDNDAFTEVYSSTTVKLLRDRYTFLSDEWYDDAGVVEIDGYKTYGLAKIYIRIDDVTGTGKSDNVFIDWYVPETYTVDIYGPEFKDGAEKSSRFIRIIEDKRGATYATEEVEDEEDYKAKINEIQAAYQKDIEEAIAKLDDGKLYAGSDSYFYLPDFSGYVNDNFNGYTDLKYNIYYSASSTGSHTSLKSNELAVKLSEVAKYRFTIYATDAAGNLMYYPVKDSEGNVEYKTIPTDEIWEEDYEELLPFFSFDVYYKPATVEDPGEQSVGFVGTTYNASKFEIKGVSNSYQTQYNLYVFHRAEYCEAMGITDSPISYEEFVKTAEELFNNPDVRRKYFTLITPKSELNESECGDGEYQTYDYQSSFAWNSTSVTFVPQDPSEFYLVRLTLTDTGLSNTVTDKYLAVRASAKANEVPGESDWVEKNLASIILYSIAGVLVVAIILLFVIKPKDKEDIDKIDLDKPKKKKKS